MKLGVNALPQHDSWSDYLKLCQSVEKLGYADFWTYDHLISGSVTEPGPSLECLTAISALAAATTTIGLGSLVLASEFRHPSIVAKSAATISQISRGRFTLGMSAGSNPQEHAMFGLPYPPAGERVDRFAAAVRAIRELLHGRTVSCGGPFPLDEARLVPAPDPVPKIVIGARGARMLRLAAHHGDGHVSAASPHELQALNTQLDRLRRECGHDAETLERHVIVYEACGPTETVKSAKRTALERLFHRPFDQIADRILQGGEREVAEAVASYEKAGADHIIVTSVPPYDFEFLTWFSGLVEP